MKSWIALGTSGLLLVATVSWSYPEGAPARHSGGFGEADCGQCHFGGEDSPEAALTLSNLDAVRAGAETTFKLQLSDSYAEVAGFQLTIRDLDGKQLGRLVGGAQQSTQEADQVTYLTHNAPAEATNGAAQWQIVWQAPNTLPAALVVNASVVAANHDESPLGDSVLVLEQRIKPAD